MQASLRILRAERDDATPPPRPAAIALPDADRALIEAFRSFARAAQLTPPLDLNRVCSLLDPTPASYGAALLRALDATACRRLVFHPRDAAEVGFDEMWLLRLVRALQAGDSGSARLLIGGRVPGPGRRVVAWLAGGYADMTRAGLDGDGHELRIIPRNAPSGPAISDRRHA